MIRRFVKNSFIFGSGTFLPKAVSFLLIPVYTRSLTTSDYGILGLSAMISGILTVFFCMALHGAVIRFYHDLKDEEE